MSRRPEVSLPGVHAGGVPFAKLVTRAETMRWADQGLCAQIGPMDKDFYPPKGGQTTVAKRICQGCPVVSDCLEWALRNDERFGFWGGMSPNQREREIERRDAIDPDWRQRA